MYLIKGDLSGIQKFIFNVLSDGAARSIRGRSFFLKILLETTMKAIFDGLDIIDASAIELARISTSGGSFILKVDKNPDKTLEQVENGFLNALRYVDINLILAFTELSSDYASSLEKLDENIRVKKYQLYSKVSSDFFEPFDHDEIKVNENDKWSDIAASIINANIDSWNIIKNDTAGLLKTNNQKIYFAGYEVQFTKGGKYPLHKYIESYNPRESDRNGNFNPNQYKQFEHFAKDGSGLRKLGILAMDVDGLGAYFNDIQTAEEHKRFDYRLYDFFNNHLRIIIEKNYSQKVYPVTAGGDDSYFVGHWSIMLSFSKQIKKDFLTEFSSTSLNISAAIVIVKPKFPVVRFVELVDDEIKKAKYTYPQSKGNISLFGEVLKWEFVEKEIEYLRGSFKNVNSQSKKGGFSAGLLAKARLTAKDIAEEDGMKLSDYWKMDYYLRNYALTNKSHYEELSRIFRDNLNASMKKLAELNGSKNKDETTLKAKNYRLIFPIAARLAELDKRTNR